MTRRHSLDDLASWYPDLAGTTDIESLCSRLPCPPCGPVGRTFHHPLWWIMNSFNSVFVRHLRKCSRYLTFLCCTFKHGLGQRNEQPAGLRVCFLRPGHSPFGFLTSLPPGLWYALTHGRYYRDLFSTKLKQLPWLKLNVTHCKGKLKT